MTRGGKSKKGKALAKDGAPRAPSSIPTHFDDNETTGLDWEDLQDDASETRVVRGDDRPLEAVPDGKTMKAEIYHRS
ncbi:hypothetical protein LIER_03595 [Lithospermum erythrorhizon]|uniref:Uncharacterized protein n=1 Tax=Lithospermum erythrorhizon TaxID=34254 RepID=A0AAV3NUG5_LITER